MAHIGYKPMRSDFNRNYCQKNKCCRSVFEYRSEIGNFEELSVTGIDSFVSVWNQTNLFLSNELT